jgi:hypothetical protein
LALVPDDEVQFQVPFRAPSNLLIHAKILLRGNMVVFEYLPITEPEWSSSIVVLPVTPPRQIL